MDLQEAKQRIEELRTQIDYHSRRYYDEDAPEIEDDEFDALTRELRQLEERFPSLVTSDSYTQQIKGSVSSRFAAVRHAVPLMSLQDVFSEEELRDFDRRVRETVTDPVYVVEPKIDGLSVALEYENGVLVRAATRGDGETGEDVTHNVRQIQRVPQTLSEPLERLIARGEVYMPRKSFAALVKRQEENGEKTFKNPRNAAAGSLRQKDASVTKERELDLFVFNLQLTQGEELRSHVSSIKRMQELGLPVIPDPVKVNTIDEAIEQVRRLGEQRSQLAYDMDGAVIKLDDFSHRELLGVTGKYPKWAVAFKYPPEEKETVLRRVEFQVGRTGVITPIGVFDPVMLAGTTVSRATLHNEDFICQKQLGIGDTVVLRKAGEIIPEVVRVLRQASPTVAVTFPNTCPSCGEAVHREEGEAAVRCINPECAAQQMRMLVHFASRDAMDIEGLGPAVVEALTEQGIVRHAYDFYTMKAEDIAAIERMGAKSAENLIAAVNASKDNPLFRVVYALGIRHIGQKAAKLLSEHFGSMEAIMNATEEELGQIEGFGEVMARSVKDYFASPSAKHLVEQLASFGVNMIEITEKEDDRFAGMTFVLTGTLPTMTRNEAAALIERFGGKTSSSVSKKTSIVLAGAEAGSKLVKAQQLGVRVIDEETFMNMIGYGEELQ